MAHDVVTGPDLPPALGPYSPVIRAGNLLFVSAQTGVDPDTGQMPDGGFEAECRQALTNLQQALRAADADLGNVVKAAMATFPWHAALQRASAHVHPRAKTSGGS